MRRYGGGMLYAALPLHMQRGCFRIRTHDQQVTKAQLYRCTRARPQYHKNILREKENQLEGMKNDIMPLSSVVQSGIYRPEKSVITTN